MATINDDIAYLKDQIDKLLKRSPDKPDGMPEMMSANDWVKLREMRTERRSLCAQRWQEITTPRERFDLERRISAIPRVGHP